MELLIGFSITFFLCTLLSVFQGLFGSETHKLLACASSYMFLALTTLPWYIATGGEIFGVVTATNTASFVIVLVTHTLVRYVENSSRR